MSGGVMFFNASFAQFPQSLSWNPVLQDLDIVSVKIDVNKQLVSRYSWETWWTAQLCPAAVLRKKWTIGYSVIQLDTASSHPNHPQWNRTQQIKLVRRSIFIIPDIFHVLYLLKTWLEISISSSRSQAKQVEPWKKTIASYVTGWLGIPVSPLWTMMMSNWPGSLITPYIKHLISIHRSLVQNNDISPTA